jgi:Secretion system C-terminal sorting domain
VPDSICAGAMAVFTAVPSYGGSAPSYQWMVNDVAVGTDSIAYVFSPADSNRISVRMASNHSCAVPDTVIDSTSIRVFPNEIPMVHIAAAPGDVVCRGTSVTYVATPTYGGNSPVYAWIKDGTMVSTSPTYTYTPSDSDDVYCLMYSHYLCRIHDSAFSDAIYMSVENPSVPSVSITGRPGTIVGIGKPDTLIATVGNAGPGVTYQWYVNMAPIPAATNSVFIYSSYHNNDSVSCMVTRQDACSLSSINSVVLSVRNVGVSNVSSGAKISLVPNPNKGVFVVKGQLATTDDAELTIEITNMLGQQVYKGTIMTKNGNVDQEVQVDNAANGIYLLNLRSSGGNDVFRFVIEK